MEELVRRGAADSEQTNEFLWGLRLGRYQAYDQDRWGPEQNLLSRIDAELQAIEQARVNYQQAVNRVGTSYMWATYIIAIPCCFWWLLTGLLGWVKRGFFQPIQNRFSSEAALVSNFGPLLIPPMTKSGYNKHRSKSHPFAFLAFHPMF